MTTEKQLEQNLQLITTFHYIVAGLGALMGCFPILHLTIGLSFLFGDPIPESPDEPFPMRLFWADVYPHSLADDALFLGL